MAINSSPWELTRERIHQLVVFGLLVPFEAHQRAIGQAPGEPTGARRLLPINEMCCKNEELIRNRVTLKEREYLLCRSDQEHIDCRLAWIDMDKDSYLHSGGTCDEWEAFRNREREKVMELLPIRRAQWKGEINKLRLEIRSLEEELMPSIVWRNLNLSPKQQEDIEQALLNAWYLRDEVNKVQDFNAQNNVNGLESAANTISFYRNGYSWKVGPPGQEKDIKHSRGMEQIHWLI
jgi:hypothetical protein